MKTAVIDNAVARVCKQKGIAWNFGLTTRCRIAVRRLKTQNKATIVRALERTIKEWQRG